jgi:hypothetical protein
MFLVSIAIVTTAARARHDVFFKCVEIAEINCFNLETQLMIFHDDWLLLPSKLENSGSGWTAS